MLLSSPSSSDGYRGYPAHTPRSHHRSESGMAGGSISIASPSSGESGGITHVLALTQEQKARVVSSSESQKAGGSFTIQAVPRFGEPGGSMRVLALNHEQKAQVVSCSSAFNPRSESGVAGGSFTIQALPRSGESGGSMHVLARAISSCSHVTDRSESVVLRMQQPRASSKQKHDRIVSNTVPHNGALVSSQFEQLPSTVPRIPHGVYTPNDYIKHMVSTPTCTPSPRATINISNQLFLEACAPPAVLLPRADGMRSGSTPATPRALARSPSPVQAPIKNICGVLAEHEAKISGRRSPGSRVHDASELSSTVPYVPDTNIQIAFPGPSRSGGSSSSVPAAIMNTREVLAEHKLKVAGATSPAVLLSRADRMRSGSTPATPRNEVRSAHTRSPSPVKAPIKNICGVLADQGSRVHDASELRSTVPYLPSTNIQITFPGPSRSTGFASPVVGAINKFRGVLAEEKSKVYGLTSPRRCDHDESKVISTHACSPNTNIPIPFSNSSRSGGCVSPYRLLAEHKAKVIGLTPPRCWVHQSNAISTVACLPNTHAQTGCSNLPRSTLSAASQSAGPNSDVGRSYSMQFPIHPRSLTSDRSDQLDAHSYRLVPTSYTNSPRIEDPMKAGVIGAVRADTTMKTSVASQSVATSGGASANAMRAWSVQFPLELRQNTQNDCSAWMRSGIIEEGTRDIATHLVEDSTCPNVPRSAASDHPDQLNAGGYMPVRTSYTNCPKIADPLKAGSTDTGRTETNTKASAGSTAMGRTENECEMAQPDEDTDAKDMVTHFAEDRMCLNVPRSLTSDYPDELDFPRRIPVPTSYTNCPKIEEHEELQCHFKFAVFDFDGTLTSRHVFSSLAGYINTSRTLSVPMPHALTERGQLARLCELDADPDWGAGAFALEAFGGESRVSKLRCVLQALCDAGVECVIVSRGMVGPNSKCLEQVGLLSLFARIIGNVGSAFGEFDYDCSIMESACDADELLLGKPESDFGGADGNKSEYIMRFMKEKKIDFEQVVFIDDDIDSVMEAECICRTIHVVSDEGMQEREFQALQDIINEPYCADIDSTM